MSTARICRALLFAVGTAATAGSAEVSAALQEGIDLVNMGEFQKGVLQLEAVVAPWRADPNAHPELAKALAHLASAYYFQDQQDIARRIAGEAIRVDPNVQVTGEVFALRFVSFFETVKSPQKSASGATDSNAPPSSGSPHGRHSKTVPIAIGLGAAAAAGVVVVASGGGNGASGSPPSGTFSFTPGSPVLMGGTTVTFTGNGRAAQGDPLTYSWNFGDGSTASGQTVAHTFQSAGTLTVNLTIRDSHAAQTMVTNSILVKSITGHWVDSDPRFQLDFVQTGSTFTGSVTVSGYGRVASISSGVVSNPRAVTFHRGTLVAGFATDDYTGNLDTTLDGMNVTASQTSFSLRRQ